MLITDCLVYRLMVFPRRVLKREYFLQDDPALGLLTINKFSFFFFYVWGMALWRMLCMLYKSLRYEVEFKFILTSLWINQKTSLATQSTFSWRIWDHYRKEEPKDFHGVLHMSFCFICTFQLHASLVKFNTV